MQGNLKQIKNVSYKKKWCYSFVYVVFKRWSNVKLTTLRMRWCINSLKHVETRLKLGFQPFDAISTIAQRWFNVECSLEYVDIELSNYSEKFSFLAASWLLSKALLIHRMV